MSLFRVSWFACRRSICHVIQYIFGQNLEKPLACLGCIVLHTPLKSLEIALMFFKVFRCLRQRTWSNFFFFFSFYRNNYFRMLNFVDSISSILVIGQTIWGGLLISGEMRSTGVRQTRAYKSCYVIF